MSQWSWCSFCAWQSIGAGFADSEGLAAHGGLLLEGWDAEAAGRTTPPAGGEQAHRGGPLELELQGTAALDLQPPSLLPCMGRILHNLSRNKYNCKNLKYRY